MMREMPSAGGLRDSSSELTGQEIELLAKIDRDELVALLQELIRVPSDYPPGDCREVINILQRKLDQAQVVFQIYARNPLQPNLVAFYGSQDAGPVLLYHAHIDTVPAGERSNWTVEPFGGEIHNGRIYGRGAGDDKGSVAAQVMALLTLARAGVELHGGLQLAIVSDEESGGEEGTKWLRDARLLSPDYLLVGEQTHNQVAIAERVACGIDLTVFGKSAHGAMPWAGENAVLKAAGAIDYLRQKLFPQLKARPAGVLPPPTLNVGKIFGGIQWNIVPEYCKVELDRRLLPGETRQQAIAEIAAVLDEYNERIEPLRYELFSSGEVSANINTPPDEPFVQTAQQTLRAASGDAKSLTGYVQTSDGRWFASDGIPIILFGPGDPALAHSADEYVEIDELVEAARFLTLLGLRWLNRQQKSG